MAWHWERAQEYWWNADIAAVSGEWHKASELLWGSASQAAKMAGVLWGSRWEDHAGTFRFLRFFAVQASDPGMRRSLSTLQTLHSNFYDEILDAQGVRESAVTVWRLNGRIWELCLSRLAGA
jgi:hypothetical protein